MAKVTYLLACVGILATGACTTSSDDSDDEEYYGAGGMPGTNTPNYGTGGSVTPVTYTWGGAATTTPNIFTLGGSTTIMTSAGGTSTTTTLTGNPNRNLTPAETDAIIATACNGWSIEPEASAASKLELVIDVSSSMNNTAPGTRLTKWEVTRDALVEAVPGPVAGGGLPANTSVGLMFYPNMRNETVSTVPTDPGVCINTAGEVPMATLGGNDADSHRTLLRQRLTEAVLGLGTPTHDAYDYVLYNTVLTEAQKAIEGEPYMLLITDGMPTLYKNCYNPAGQLRNLPGDEVVAAIDTAFNHGVKTFVVGSPGSEEGRPWLSRAAYLGGTAAGGCNPNSANGPYCHMDMTTAPDFSVALRNGLAQVMSMITGCKFVIPATSADGQQVVDLDKIAPIIQYSNGTTTLVGRVNVTGNTCADGFRILSDTQMELCQNTCKQLQADALARVQFIFGCSSEDLGAGDPAASTAN